MKEIFQLHIEGLSANDTKYTHATVECFETEEKANTFFINEVMPHFEKIWHNWQNGIECDKTPKIGFYVLNCNRKDLLKVKTKKLKLYKE